jgi:hypothetical protein
VGNACESGNKVRGLRRYGAKLRFCRAATEGVALIQINLGSSPARRMHLFRACVTDQMGGAVRAHNDWTGEADTPADLIV